MPDERDYQADAAGPLSGLRVIGADRRGEPGILAKRAGDRAPGAAFDAAEQAGSAAIVTMGIPKR